MLLTTLNPPEDSSTYLQLLQTLVKNALSQGTIIHTFIAQRRLAFATQTTLLNMYAECESLGDARKVFDHMEERDSFSWNVMIAVYRRHGFPQEALRLFHQMQRAGLQPDQFTFASVLPACTKMGAYEEAMDIHQSIRDRRILSDIFVANAVVDMFAKCGRIDKARETMIAGYGQNGFFEKALQTFKQMLLAGVKPDSTTFSSILPACVKLGAFELVMNLHQDIIERGFLSDVAVANALIYMYAKCGRIEKSVDIFDEMPQRDVFSWNAMIAGYFQNGFIEKAMETFNQMLSADIMPNLTTFPIILTVCAKMEALDLGMNLHQSIIKSGFLSDVVTSNTLINMYAKCGSILKAREVFNGMPQRDAISWNIMVAGYAQNGFFERPGKHSSKCCWQM